jgi:glycosyltransferase involved in cell wall biosynthesis
MHRLHVVALPHLAVSKRNNACAYTQKVLNFCKMMDGHDVTLYAPEPNLTEDPVTDEEMNWLGGTRVKFVPTVTKFDRLSLLGPYDRTKELPTLPFKPTHPLWMLANSRTISELNYRLRPKDFICLIGGTCQKPIADAFPKREAKVVEFGIGYTGVFAPHKVFESYAHQARCLTLGNKDPNGGWSDAVIPNYYDPGDFPLGNGQGDYFLFVGRVIKRKGLAVLQHLQQTLGIKVVVAGQGATVLDAGSGLRSSDGAEFRGLTYHGYADVGERARLMAGAKALLAPTYYLEPFGGVAVEAQLCGTPAITTDWGAFPETVEHGKTGFRCRTLSHFIRACQEVERLDRGCIRERAIRKYSLDAVAKRYDDYFDTLADTGWNSLRPRMSLGFMDD